MHRPDRLLLLALFAAAASMPAPARAGSLASLIKRERSALSLLDERSREVSRSEEAIADLRYQGEQLAYQLAEAERRLTALAKRSAQRGRALRRRLRALYKLSRGSLIRLLVAARDSHQLTRHAGWLSRVVERDLKELRLYRTESNKLRAERRRVARQQRRQSELAVRLELEHQVLDQARAKQERLFRRIRASRTLRVKLAGELSAGQQRLLRQLAYHHYRVRYAGRFSSRKGLLGRPVSRSSIAAGFNRGTDRRSRLDLARSGITFRSPRRARARAVAPGTVRLTQEVPGYGKVVVLDHGDGYYTLTGFLGRALVKSGQQVVRGGVLGLAGHDPLDGRPAVYFELRHRQRAIDPTKWFRR